MSQFVVEKEKLAIGAGTLVTILSIKAVQPISVVPVSLTVWAVAEPINVWVIFGLPGKLIVTGVLPSPKSQTQIVMYEENPVGTKA